MLREKEPKGDNEMKKSDKVKKFNKVKNELMDAVKKVLENNGFKGYKLEAMMDEVDYGLFCEHNLSAGFRDYFGV